jgi:hypothetical protein
MFIQQIIVLVLQGNIEVLQAVVGGTGLELLA